MGNFHAFRTAAELNENSFCFIPHRYRSQDWSLVYRIIYAQNCLRFQTINCSDLPAKPPQLVIVYKWRQCTKTTRLSFWNLRCGFTQLRFRIKFYKYFWQGTGRHLCQQMLAFHSCSPKLRMRKNAESIQFFSTTNVFLYVFSLFQLVLVFTSQIKK